MISERGNGYHYLFIRYPSLVTILTHADMLYIIQPSLATFSYHTLEGLALIKVMVDSKNAQRLFVLCYKQASTHRGELI
jgi:hypothetical protein